MQKITFQGNEYTISEELANRIATALNNEATHKFHPSSGEEFFTIDDTGSVDREIWADTQYDNERKEVANVCSDFRLMLQRAYTEKLSRLLWRFAHEHGGVGTWYFYIDNNGNFDVEEVDQPGVLFLTPSFASKEVAENAIQEVVEPFCKENPKFIWRYVEV